MRFTLYSLLLGTLLCGQTQETCTFEVKGRILDAETGEPLPFATIKLLNSEKGAISDANGYFTIDEICEKEIDFEVRFLGHKAVKHHHDFRTSEQANQKHTVYLAPDENLLESVVVEGQEIVGNMQSISLSQIDRATITAKGTQSLASAISDIQGVTFTSNGTNVQTPVIHGLYGNRILIINNGVKHGFQNWGTDHAPEIDIASADNISVLKGAAGVRYGPEAIGGVVVVEGNPLELSNNFYGDVSSGFETNGRGYRMGANFGAGYNRFSYHVGGNFIQVGDRHTPDYNLTNTGKKELSGNVGLRYHLPEWDFKVYYSYVDQELGLFRGSVAESLATLSRAISADRPADIFTQDFSYNIEQPSQSSTHHLGKFEVDWYSDFGKVSFLFSQQVNLRQEFGVRRDAELPIIDLQLNTSDIRLEWNHPSLIGFEGTIGLQYFSQNNDNNPGTNTTAFIPNYNTHRYSAYVIESLQKGNSTFEIGLRFDHEYNSVRGRRRSQAIFRNQFSFTNFTASLGLVQDLSEKWQLRSNVGSAWRTANMAELYRFGQHGSQLQYGLWRYFFEEDGRLNTDRVLTEEDGVARPEKGFKWINELEYKSEKSRLTMTAYSQFIQNFIFDRPLGVLDNRRGPMPAFSTSQTDAVLLGGDITYVRKLTNILNTKMGASYLWSRNVKRNEVLINQPPINLSTEISWNTPAFFELNHSKLSLSTTYTFEQFQAPQTFTPDQLGNGIVEVTSQTKIFDFKDAPEGYFLANVRYEWRWNKLGGQLEARNIANVSYRDYLNEMRYFADEPGRNFLIALYYRF